MQVLLYYITEIVLGLTSFEPMWVNEGKSNPFGRRDKSFSSANRWRRHRRLAMLAQRVGFIWSLGGKRRLSLVRVCTGRWRLPLVGHVLKVEGLLEGEEVDGGQVDVGKLQVHVFAPRVSGRDGIFGFCKHSAFFQYARNRKLKEFLTHFFKNKL